MTILFLNLKGEYFDEIKSGAKKIEYRLYNDYWKKRLLTATENGGVFKKFSQIVIRRGYPKTGDKGKEIVAPWRGVMVDTITHPHFGSEPTKVFCIIVADT